MTVEDQDTWMSKDCFRVLLFTLLIGTTAHNLDTLLERAGGKICVINHFLETDNQTYCAIVGFESENKLESAFCTESIFGDVKLLWAKLDLLARLYAKKNVLISCPAVFSNKLWAQVVSFASSFGGLQFDSGSGSFLSGALDLDDAMCNVRSINVSAKQEDVVCWHKDSGNIILVIMETKLRPNIMHWIMNRFNGVQIFTSGLDISFFDTGVAIIMDNFLVCHVFKVEEISSCVVSVHFLFKDKTSVLIVSLYAGASSGVRFSLVSEVNFFIVWMVNSSTFVVLGGDFNKNRFRKSTSFGFCSNLSLVNFFGGHFLASAPT
ncbi:hypothetical protein G9A89_014492 [Geosiphon pyriformis]|nr:hypothetical protein G9A89_014492 [Geosiphon pyriformis]